MSSHFYSLCRCGHMRATHRNDRDKCCGVGHGGPCKCRAFHKAPAVVANLPHGVSDAKNARDEARECDARTRLYARLERDLKAALAAMRKAGQSVEALKLMDGTGGVSERITEATADALAALEAWEQYRIDRKAGTIDRTRP